MSEDVERIAIVERLRRKVQRQPAFGGGSISLDGKFTSYISDDGKRYVNPDGPEAATLIEEMADWIDVALDDMGPGQSVCKATKDALAAILTKLKGGEHG